MQTAGFRYGISASSLNSTVYGSFSGGSISASLTGLNPGTTYYCQAYATVCGTGDKSSSTATFYGEVKSFTTESASPVEPAVDKDWLELPAGVDDNSGRYVVNTTYDSERNYTVCYDTQMMTPLWTAYPLNSGHMGSLARPGSWSYNPDIPQQYQANLISHSYSNSAYARGHMCPNGSRNGNSTMQKQTFYVTNQVPQIQNKFNGGIWAALEGAVQGAAAKEEIYVVTGVAFNKQGENRVINYVSPADDSSQRCPVPNYFYKVVLKVKYSGSTVTSACAVGFWFEHNAYTDSSYANYSVPVDQIEQWTGFDFFVNLPDSVEESAESSSTTWSAFNAF